MQTFAALLRMCCESMALFKSNLWSLFVVRARNSLIPTFVWIVWLGQYVYIMSFTFDRHTLSLYTIYTALIYCISHSLRDTLNAKLIHYCRQIAEHNRKLWLWVWVYGCGTSVALYILYRKYIAYSPQQIRDLRENMNHEYNCTERHRTSRPFTHSNHNIVTQSV